MSSRIAYSDAAVTFAVSVLESRCSSIRDEYLSAVLGVGAGMAAKGLPLPADYDVGGNGGDHPQALHNGNWDWHSYIQKGVRSSTFKNKCPKTAEAIDDLGEDLFQTPFAFAFFSTLHPKSSIKPHSGPMNLRLRIHLPLIVPPSVVVAPPPPFVSQRPERPPLGLNVGPSSRTWEYGKCVVLDDSFVHEVWNDSDGVRVVLVVDIWHPDVDAEERRDVVDMFSFAKKRGWIKQDK